MILNVHTNFLHPANKKVKYEHFLPLTLAKHETPEMRLQGNCTHERPEVGTRTHWHGCHGEHSDDGMLKMGSYTYMHTHTKTLPASYPL